MRCWDTHIWNAFPHYAHTSPVLVVCLWSTTQDFTPIKVPCFPLLLQECRWPCTPALSVSGSSRTVPVSMDAFRIYTSTMSSRTSPRHRWSLAWYRAASPARRSTACTAYASPMASRDQCATASQAGLGRSAIRQPPTPARAPSTLVNGNTVFNSRHLSAHCLLTQRAVVKEALKSFT